MKTPYRAPWESSPAEQDDESEMSEALPNDKPESKGEVKVTAIHIRPTEKTMTTHHEDGKKADSEFENFEDLKDKLGKFFGEEEKEFKEYPEDEDESHKDSLSDDEDSEENPFSSAVSKFRK